MKARAKIAVAYARYSTDVQKDRSIDDQVELCRQIAARYGAKVVDVYSDRGKSGASMFERDGLLKLMNAAKQRKFDFVISESLSRLSRDMEDTAAIYKRLDFNGIKIIDSNGEVSDIHVGVGGIVNSMFLKNLAVSVTRGREARVREGLIPGKLAYGYRKVPGKPGMREIDADQAKIVRRVFEEYANGSSTRAIAVSLMAEGVISPSGTKQWNHQKLVSGSGGAGGLLGNYLYIGKLKWNSLQQFRNPETGKKSTRKSEKQAIEIDVPHLRIIPQDLWDRVQAMRAKRRRHMDERGPRVSRMGDKDRLLVGLLTCAECGSRMMIGQANMDGSPRVVCGHAYHRMVCTHRKSYCLKTLTQKTLDDVKLKLTDPARLIKLAKAYHERHAERQKQYRGEREAVQKEYNRVTVALDRIVNAIGMLDDEPVEALVAKMKTLRVEKAALQSKLTIIEAQTNIVELRPAAIDKFSKAVHEVHKALTGDLEAEHLAPFQLAFHNMIHSVVVHPTPKRAEYRAEPILRVSAINGFEIQPGMPSIEEMLAEQGLDASKIVSASGNQTRHDRNSEGLISLGFFGLAA